MSLRQIDYAYITSYNECDRLLVTGLRDAFARRGQSFAVIGYTSCYIADLHRSLGVEFVNLRLPGKLPALDLGRVQAIEERLQWPAGEFVFPEGMGYRSRREKLLRRLVAVDEGYERLFSHYRIGCLIHKLGAELVRRLGFAHARKHGTTSVLLGNFPAHYPGRLYLHSQLSSERDDRPAPPPNVGDHVSFDDFSALIDRIRDRKEVVRYPAPGGRTWGEARRILWSMTRHGELEFVDDMLRRRLVMFQQFYRQAFAFWGGKSEIPNAKFYYFPLHVHDDSQITLRNPQFCDQLWIIEYISRSLPSDIRLVVKFHPGLDGSMPLRFVRSMRALENVVLLRGRVNSHEVVRQCLGVIVINSTVAFEALLQSKPVLVLGRWAFGRLGMTLHCDDLSTLPGALGELRRFRPDPQGLRRTLYDLYGEMYRCSFNREPIEHDQLAAALSAYALEHRSVGAGSRD